MTVSEFIQLTTARQLEVLSENAAVVGKRCDMQGRYFLFQLDSFYIELKANLYDDSVIRMICFTDTSGLNKYLESIDISSLFYNTGLN